MRHTSVDNAPWDDGIKHTRNGNLSTEAIAFFSIHSFRITEQYVVNLPSDSCRYCGIRHPG